MINKKAVKKTGGLLYKLFRTVFLLGIAYIILFPLLYAITTSLKSTPDLTDPTVTWLPKSLALQNFSYAFEAMDYANTFLFTVIVCVGSALLQTASCAVAGYSFARLKFKGQNILFVMVIVMMILPPQALLVPMYANYSNLDFLGILSLLRRVFPSLPQINLLNKPFVFYLPAFLGVGIRSSFMIFIYRQFFKGLPKELEEAAWIDGAGPVKTFVKIVIPSISVAILVVFIFSIVWYWNDYQQSSMYFSETTPLAVRLVQIEYDLENISELHLGQSVDISNYTMAGVLLFLAPILFLYLFVQRRFIRGIANTGLVG